MRASGCIGASPSIGVLRPLGQSLSPVWKRPVRSGPADVYRVRYATTNAGLLYTAKGTASLLVPLGNVLAQATGSWRTVFLVAAAMNFAAPLVLRPLRLRHQAAL